MRTGEKEDRRTRGHEDRKTVFILGSATFCQVPLLPSCNLPVYKYTLSVINLQLICVSVYKYTVP